MKTEIKPDTVDNWTSKPICCPFCGSKKVVEFSEWASVSTNDVDNTALITEFQCNGNCEGRSFWI